MTENGDVQSATLNAADESPSDDSTRQAVDMLDEGREIEPRTWPAEETQWIEAKFLAPLGAPGSESAWILALEDDMDYEEVHEHKGPVFRLAQGHEPLRINDVLAAQYVKAGEVARLALPPDVEEAWLFVSGTYVHSIEPREFAPADVTEPLQLKPELGALVTGRLIPSGDGASLKNVEVSLDWSIGSSLQLGGGQALDLERETRTDSEGRFEFRAVPVGRPQVVATKSDDFASAFSDVFSLTGGEHHELDLSLSLGGVVRGRIVDDTGAPVALADVEILGREFFGNPTTEFRNTVSGADGLFEMSGIPPGRVWIHAEHEDYQEVLTSVIELADLEERDYGDLVLSSGSSISGIVTFPGGSSATGTKLQVLPDMGENMTGAPGNPRAHIGARNDAIADETGAFEIVGLGEGPWALTAEYAGAEGAEHLGRWTASRKLVRAPSANLMLTLEAPVQVSGTVTDLSGESITAFSIKGERDGSQWYMPPSETKSEEFESEEGRFTLGDLRSGSWKFTASAEGYADSDKLELVLPSDQPLEFALSRPVRLLGQVHDPEGLPISGAEVTKEFEGAEVFQAMQGRGDWPTTQTDEEGNFILEGLRPGAGSIVAKKDGFAQSEGFGYELAEGEDQDAIVLTLRRGGSISGEIFDAKGGPAANCLVIMQQPTMTERRMTNADSSGKFSETGLTPGTWQVQAFPGVENLGGEDGEGFDQAALIKVLKMTTVELVDLADEYVVLGAPPEDPVRVHGRVTLDGEGIEELMVSFVSAGGGGMDLLKIASTDDEGAYDLQLDEPGEYLVTIQTSGIPGEQNSIEYRRDVPKGEVHQLDFDMPLARISGRVTNTDGKAQEGVRVTLSMQTGQVFGTVFGGQYNETLTDAQGRYEILFLRPGEFSIAAGGQMLGGMLGGSSGLGRLVRAVAVGENEWVRDLDFELEEPGTIAGVVRDTGGSPVSSATIFVRDNEGQLVELFSLIETNASGSFEYPGLAPGRYTITARTEEHSSLAGETIRVKSGETTDATVVVQPGTMLLVTLEDKSGADIRSRVSVLDENSLEMNGMMGLAQIMDSYTGELDNKAQRIGPLSPGVYRVQAFAADGRSTSKKVTLSGQDERKLKLRLR